MDDLQEKEIVHFDVQGSGKLIDFDLVDKVGTDYPVNYNDEFYECHPTAKEENSRQTFINFCT